MPFQIDVLSEDNLQDTLRILAANPLENITLIADCTQLGPWCDVNVLKEGGAIKAVFSLYEDLDFKATAFWSVSSSHLKIIMEEYADRLQDSGFVAICTGSQLEQLKKVCSSIDPIRERQMYTDPSTTLTCRCDTEPARLSRKDAEELKELYNVCGTPAWTPNALELGPFYGIRNGEDRLVSVAGVHYVTSYGAEIGNVATHPQHRRRGYAQACTKAVTQEVLKKSMLVVLHFFTDNHAAQTLYENMGFQYSLVDPVFFVKAEI
ncbi:GNAT family N-acetyltransferase [Candidatus Thorarchaeota archaeon]|nr:MAG: GNAT family N-acetyltransferase [Candidatus Thorarchaeota archaeon]